MARTLTFVPVARAEAVAFAAGEALDVPRAGFAATKALYEALEYTPDQDEEAEHAAMLLASVWALAEHGERLVLVAELPDTSLGAGEGVDLHNGSVTVRTLPAGAVVAWYADAAGTPTVQAAEAASGQVLDDAWDAPAVQRLLAEHELLWHGVEELGTLV